MSHFKILILGDPAVGKSCFLVRYADNVFTEAYMSTIGMDYKFKNVELDDGNTIRLQIWDTAGQERFRTITKNLYKGAAGIVLIYDITMRKTFENVRKWIKNINEEAPDKIILILVGNKADLEDKREVQIEEGEEMAEEYNIPFFECSAQSGLNIKSVFIELAKQLVERQAKLGDKGQILQGQKRSDGKQSCC
jgi:small GTP-binding protein